MSGSETECDDGSSDDLTPIICTQRNSPQYSYRESLSQLDAMLPALAYSDSTEKKKNEHADTAVPLFIRKRPSILVPLPAQVISKIAARPPLSEDALRLEALRIARMFPRGEPTMWSIMQALDYKDLRLLCKYQGVKFPGTASKADMGQRVLKLIQKGDFKSLLDGTYDSMGRKRISNASDDITSGTSSASAALDNTEKIIVKNDRKAGSSSSSSSCPTPVRPVPIPVVAVGGHNNWKQVDHCENIEHHEMFICFKRIIPYRFGLQINTTIYEVHFLNITLS